MKLSQLIKELQIVQEHLEDNGIYGGDPEVCTGDPGGHIGTEIETADYFIKNNKLLLSDYTNHTSFLRVRNESVS